MEKLELYSVFDRVAEDYGPIFQAKNVGVAVRSFHNLMSQVKDINEYDLVRIGYLYHDMTLESSKHTIDLNNPKDLEV